MIFKNKVLFTWVLSRSLQVALSLVTQVLKSVNFTSEEKIHPAVCMNFTANKKEIRFGAEMEISFFYVFRLFRFGHSL